MQPPHLVEKHRQAAHALLSQYATPLQDTQVIISETTAPSAHSPM